jgi:excisionase family DNA binding protein
MHVEDHGGNMDKVSKTESAVPKVTISVAETALSLGVCERVVMNLVRSGELPAIRLGARILIRMQDLHEWAALRADRTGEPVRPDLSRRMKNLSTADQKSKKSA